MAWLPSDKGHGVGGSDCPAAHLAAVAIDPRRHVDGNNRPAAVVDALHERPGLSFKVPGKPCTEQRIDDDMGFVDCREVGQTYLAVPVTSRGSGIALQCPLLAEERELDPKATSREDARRNKAVATIVSWPAEHEDAGTGTRCLANSTRDRPAGPFHEDAPRGAGRDGGGIARPHFGIAEEFEHVAPPATLAVSAGKDKTRQTCTFFA